MNKIQRTVMCIAVIGGFVLAVTALAPRLNRYIARRSLLNAGIEVCATVEFDTLATLTSAKPFVLALPPRASSKHTAVALLLNGESGPRHPPEWVPVLIQELNLRAVRIDNMELSDAFLRRLAQCNSLRELCCFKCRISSRETADAALSSDTLVSLQMSQCNLRELKSVSLPALSMLFLDHNVGLQESPFAGFFVSAEKLEEVFLLGDSPKSAWGLLDDGSTLKILSADLKALAENPVPLRDGLEVQHFELLRCESTPTAMSIVRQIHGVREALLSGAGIGDAVALALCQRNRGLTRLLLRGCSIECDTIKRIVELLPEASVVIWRSDFSESCLKEVSLHSKGVEIRK